MPILAPALLRPPDRSSPTKILYLSRTFSASALISIRCPDGYFSPGNWEKLQQISCHSCSCGLANKRKQAEEIPAEPNIMHMTII